MIEMTVHCLAATLGLFALGTELQDEIFENIIAVIGHNRVPVSGSDPSLAIWILIRFSGF